MSKEFRNEPLRQLRTICLSSNEPTRVIINGKERVTLGQMLGDMQDLIALSLRWDMNPLEHYRGYFPSFEFSLKNPRNLSELLNAVSTSDYTLVADGVDWRMGIVTITRIALLAGTEKMICYCPANQLDTYGAWSGAVEALGTSGVRMLIWDEAKRDPASAVRLIHLLRT